MARPLRIEFPDALYHVTSRGNARGVIERHRWVCHALQGRYAAILIEREGHCLEVSRYVVLNPVRAGLAEAAERYRWSSLRATLGLAQAAPWLTTATILAAFGSRARYLEFVREGATTRSPWANLRGPLLGSEALVESLGPRLHEQIGQPEIVRRERLVHRERLEALFPSSLVTDRRRRDDRIRQAVSTQGYTFAEIGRHLGLHYSTVSRIARSLGVRS
jgi:REP-associated tyrosine transposase